MANSFLYTPCKDKKYERCKNYTVKCDECTRRHDYTVLLAKPHADYFKIKK